MRYVSVDLVFIIAATLIGYGITDGLSYMGVDVALLGIWDNSPRGITYWITLSFAVSIIASMWRRIRVFPKGFETDCDYYFRRSSERADEIHRAADKYLIDDDDVQAIKGYLYNKVGEGRFDVERKLGIDAFNSIVKVVNDAPHEATINIKYAKGELKFKVKTKTGGGDVNSK